MPKLKGEKPASKLRHQPLEEVKPLTGGSLKPIRAPRKTKNDRDDDDDDGSGGGGGAAALAALSPKVRGNIMKEARLQRFEAEGGDLEFPEDEDEDNGRTIDSDNEGDDDDDEGDDDDGGESNIVAFEGDYVSGVGLTEEEDALVQRFLHASRQETRNLADIILEKIKEKEEMKEHNAALEAASAAAPAQIELPTKVVDVYTAVGRLLSHYRSGKVPKAMKMLPHLKNWEDVLWITRPDSWSAQACYACTRIFASNLNSRMAQRYYNIVLLERCRDDIRKNKKLNYHLYMSLKKALYKPGAFYKGILLPLAQSMTCSLRESAIIGSVLARASVQAIHSSAALLRLLEMPYSGSTSMFIRVLINKKYSLPRRVVCALVDHFVAFTSETRKLPILWHTALLVFAQRYKLSLDAEQKNALRELVKVQNHFQISLEIRRELNQGV